ncbi:hypothetical protein K435DRAFT_811594 [Dendrothele bispora CBS 962.96]|uniref:SUN domain-containing protein n=1 Tax=Dendrothele bispora (strain CBS 962.96) TaxID=1314807 RepID=A0A4S8KRJ3_DENBC|nr:hypothetical protein K435DRAFT_811594 [Dendrothele bispora CBS 962.96]
MEGSSGSSANADASARSNGKRETVQETLRTRTKINQRLQFAYHSFQKINFMFRVLAGILCAIAVIIPVTAPSWKNRGTAMAVCFLIRFACMLSTMIVSTDVPLNCDGEFYHRLWSEEPGPDYGLAVRGGEIVAELTTPTLGYSPLSYSDKLVRSWDRYNWDQQHQDIVIPQTVIGQSVRVGECWAFAGTRGHIGIQLVIPISLTQIVLHYPNTHRLLERELRQAPKTLVVWALVEEHSLMSLEAVFSTRPANHFSKKGQDSSMMKGGVFVAAANIEYRPEDGMAQSFPVLKGAASLRTGVVVVEVVNNWGGEATCLYKFGVHGTGE